MAQAIHRTQNGQLWESGGKCQGNTRPKIDLEAGRRRTFFLSIFYLLFWHAEQIAHILDLLEMERHIGSENDLNDQSSEFPDIIINPLLSEWVSSFLNGTSAQKASAIQGLYDG